MTNVTYARQKNYIIMQKLELLCKITEGNNDAGNGRRDGTNGYN